MSNKCKPEEVQKKDGNGKSGSGNSKGGGNGSGSGNGVKIATVPFDPRFPQQNQTINCFVHYTDYFRCMDLLNGDESCEYFKKVFTTLCPHAWVAKWDEQREIGNFPGRLIRVPADYCLHKKRSSHECD